MNIKVFAFFSLLLVVNTVAASTQDSILEALN